MSMPMWIKSIIFALVLKTVSIAPDTFSWSVLQQTPSIIDGASNQKREVGLIRQLDIV
jgi:hypothetical protein